MESKIILYPENKRLRPITLDIGTNQRSLRAFAEKKKSLCRDFTHAHLIQAQQKINDICGKLAVVYRFFLFVLFLSFRLHSIETRIRSKTTAHAQHLRWQPLNSIASCHNPPKSVQMVTMSKFRIKRAQINVSVIRNYSHKTTPSLFDVAAGVIGKLTYGFPNNFLTGK